jgi:hypothetical protein
MEGYWNVHLAGLYLELEIAIFMSWPSVLTCYMAVISYLISIKFPFAYPAIGSIIMK